MKLCKVIAAVLLLSLLGTGIYFLLRDRLRENREESSESSETETEEEKVSLFDPGLTLHVRTETGIRPMALDTYLLGVLLAEMPADFPPEALKAQAVASRTFALRGSGKHPGAEVCTDPGCCQGWQDPLEADMDTLLCLGRAVRETDGLVLTYGDRLIESTFFSCSGGTTESAVAVWGTDVPYLRAVDSPGEEAAPRFSQEVTVPAEEFAARLRSLREDCCLTGPPDTWLGPVTRTPGGGVDCAVLGGVAFTGQELRKLFSLTSTAIEFSMSGEEIRLQTRGFGHRVGMSQYGARAMALEGENFSTILEHYYDGAKIKRLFLREQP